MDNASNNLMWLQTIFCQFNDDKFYKEILDYAVSIDCSIAMGEKQSDDIVAIPAFVLIVDRNAVGRKHWDFYLEFIMDVKDDIPCVVLDDNMDLKSPKHSNIYYISPSEKRKLEIVKRIVDFVHSKAVLKDLMNRVSGYDEVEELLKKYSD